MAASRARTIASAALTATPPSPRREAGRRRRGGPRRARRSSGPGSRRSAPGRRRVGAQGAAGEQQHPVAAAAPASDRSCSATTAPRPLSTVARNRSSACSWWARSSPAIGSSSNRQGRLLRQRARQVHPVALAARQLGDGPLGERRRVGRRQRARDGRRRPRPIRAESAPRCGRRPSATASRTVSGISAGASCGSSAARPRDLAARQRRAAAVPQRHAARRRRVQPQHQAQQRRLARAVGTAERDQLAGRDREADVLKHDAPRSRTSTPVTSISAASWPATSTRRRTSSARNTGAPTAAVTTPTGISARDTLRATTSAITRNTPPPTNDSGTSARVRRPDRQPQHVRHQQADEADRPGDRDRRADHQRARQHQPHPHPRHVDADRLRADLAQQQRVEVARVRRDDRRADQRSPARRAAGDPRSAPRGRRAAST